MTTNTAHRFPLEPLLRAAGRSLTIRERVSSNWSALDIVSITERDELATLADLLGVSKHLLERRLRSGIDEWEADRWCMAIGVHPVFVFDDWVESGLGDDEVLEATA